MTSKRSAIDDIDILASIKQMVETEKNDSVLELTDMLTDDGKIVKVSSETTEIISEPEETDMNLLLKLMKENDIDEIEVADLTTIISTDQKDDKDTTDLNGDYIKNIVRDIVSEYLSKNLAAITKEVIADEVKKMLRKL